MNPRIKFYNEKYFYLLSDVPEIEDLIQKEICEVKGQSVLFNRTGIVILKGIIYIILPCGYKKSDEYYDILLMFDLFDRLNYEKKLDAAYYDLIDIEYQGNGQLLTIAYEIIKDYRENGVIKVEYIKQGINIGGKINWKKTVKLRTQILSEEGMPIFTDLVMTRKEIDREALLRSLHMYAINKSIAMFGVLWGISTEYDEDSIQLPVDKEYAVKFLMSEKNQTYNTRLLRIIDLIIKFIDADEDEDSNDSFMALSTRSFYTVWELMCKIVLRDEYDKYKDKIPKPYWVIDNGEPKFTEQIPDIIYRGNNELYIIDAKYYNLKKNRPGWPDLVKQYFYSLSLQTVLKDIGKPINIMVFPGDITETVEYYGYSEVENAPQFGQVKGIILNTKEVVESYCYGSNKDYRRLIKEIMKPL